VNLRQVVLRFSRFIPCGAINDEYDFQQIIFNYRLRKKDKGLFTFIIRGERYNQIFRGSKKTIHIELVEVYD
jgi:hypothetical protein